MSDVQYPFIDVAVHERVSEAFAAGMAVVLFAPELRAVTWANGRGAALFGFNSIYDFLDQGLDRAELIFRQVEPIARSLSAVGDRRSFTIRIASGFLKVAVQARCEMIRFQNRPAILLSVPVDNQALSLEERAERLIEGFDDPETHMAVLDGDGRVLAASAQFAALDLSAQTARMLVSMVGNDRHRLVKRPIATVGGYLPAAIGRVSEDPALNLLFVVGSAGARQVVSPVEAATPVVETPAPDMPAFEIPEFAATDPERDEPVEMPSLPAEELVVEEASGDDMPAEDVAAEDMPAEEMPADELLAGDEQIETADDAEQLPDYEEALSAVAAIEDNPEIEEEISLDAAPEVFSEEEDAGENAAVAAEEIDHDEDMPAEDVAQASVADDASGEAEGPMADDAQTEDEPVADETVSDLDAAVEVPVADDATGDVDEITASEEDTDALDEVADQPAPTMAAMADEDTELAPATVEAARPLRTVRFVWKIDASGRFSEISREFAEAVGPHAADIAGMAFSDLAALFNLDPDGKITELLSKRDTWSGKTIWWPVEGTPMVVPVDLAALPTYTRAREFDGFRGFGIVRMGDAADDPNAAGLSLGMAPQALLEQPSDATQEPVAEEEAVTADEQPADDAGETVAANDDTAVPGEANSEAAAEDWPEGERPALKLVDNPGLRKSDKVVRLQERRMRLSPGEQANFQEIARRLDTFVNASDETEKTEEDLETLAQDVTASGEQQAEAEMPSPAGEEPSVSASDEDADSNATSEPEIDASEAADEIEDEPEAETAEFEAEAEFGDADEPVTNIAPEGDAEAAAENVVPFERIEDDGFEPEVDDFASPEMTDAEPELTEAEALAAMMPGRDRIGLSGEIIDQMPVALLVHAGDRLIHANGEFLKLTGYASLEALEDIGGLDALLQRQELEDKTSEAGGMVVVRADDVIVPVTARLQSIRFDNAAALMLALMPAAVEAEQTEEQTAEVLPLHPIRSPDQLAKLQVEVEELRAILETATDGVVIIGSDGEVRSMNRAASALFNFDGDEINGKPFVTLFAHESQRAIVDYLSGLSGHGVASVLNDGREVIGREASGGFIPLFMTIGRLTSSNGYCAVIRDITQWKRTEEELRTAKRAAETSSAHKTEFLAHVSHEIRTPLNAIIGFADMMASERLGPVGHPRYVEYANDIGRSGRHVLDIVNDLLDISKIEAGELDLDFVAVGLNETVSEAVSLVQPQANGQRVIIRTALSQSVPQVVADLRSIKQIVLNILSNAIRFTPSGGQIVVSTAYEPNGNVVLRVRDTGIGMTRAELELAMKPFRQVAGASRKRGDGTGLGLPLTKAMVDANRANFAIASEPNEGTLVEITFPSQRVLAS